LKVTVVVKTPVDLDGAFEFIGAFASRQEARAACVGAGTYTIATMMVGRTYRNDLFAVEVIRVMSQRELS
jgi:hypothetical protein